MKSRTASILISLMMSCAIAASAWAPLVPWRAIPLALVAPGVLALAIGAFILCFVVDWSH